MINRIAITILVSLSGMFLLNCPPQVCLDVIVLVDVSCSVPKDGYDRVLAEIDSVIDELTRGDRLTIIPVVADVSVNIHGLVQKTTWPVRREARDKDLMSARTQARNNLNSLKSFTANRVVDDSGRTLECPFAQRKTDLLGAIQVASEQLPQNGGTRVILVLSDFLHDDRDYNFLTLPSLNHEDSAKKLASEIQQSGGLNLTGAIVYLGFVQSVDWGGVALSRRTAITAFWREYLKRSGSSNAVVKTDGVGQLREFLSSVRGV